MAQRACATRHLSGQDLAIWLRSFKFQLLRRISRNDSWPSENELRHFRETQDHLRSQVAQWAHANVVDKSQPKLYALAQEMRHIHSLIEILFLYNEIYKNQLLWSSSTHS